MAINNTSSNDEIVYNKAAFDEVANAYDAGKKQAEEIRDGINNSIKNIQTYWTGSDDVIASRDADIKKIQENLETIMLYLNSTCAFLADKNASLASAATAYRSDKETKLS